MHILETAKKLFMEGLEFMAQERHVEAESAFRQALEYVPDRVSVLTNLSAAMLKQLKFAEAEPFARKSVELDEVNEQGWLNLGVCLEREGRLGEALDCIGKAISIRPDYAEAWSKRGNLLGATGRQVEALASYENALATMPQLLEALVGYANVLSMQARHEEALQAYEEAFAIKPETSYLAGHLMHTRMQLCEWAGIGQLVDRVMDSVRNGEKAATPLELIAVTASADVQKKCGEIFSADCYPAVDSFTVMPHRPGKKIRLGYFSSDFRNHAVSFLVAGLIETHDRSRFDVIGFNLREQSSDEMGKRLSAGFDALVDLSTLDTGSAIERIRRESLDIAVDLNGYTTGLRTELFSHRVAPVQVSYLGFPATMGAGFMDYIIGDSMLIPEDMRPAYSEKIAYLPDSFQVNDNKRPLSAAMNRSDAGLPDDKFVFCSFCNSYKLTPEIFGIWLRLLASVDNSVLWLAKKCESQSRRLGAIAAKHGISEERLIFAELVPYDRHLSRYALADLGLDTQPFGGGATTSDALWAGVPIVTCLGEAFAGRMSASLLNAIGLPELVTRSLEEYESLAYELATAPQKLSELKNRIARNRPNCSLFDTARFTGNLETAYTMMHDRARAGLRPDHIVVAQPIH